MSKTTYQDAIAYSRNFAEAKPDIGRTEREHILGLAKLLEQAETQLAEEKAAREQVEDAYDRVAQMGIEAEQRIDQLEAQMKYLREIIHDYYVQRKCGCNHPACRSCEDDAEIEAALAQPQEAEKPETLPLIARETAERLDGPSAEIGNLYATVNGKVYRITSHDEHGLPVVPRTADIPEWAKYRWRSYEGWRYERHPAVMPSTFRAYEWQRIEDFDEREASHD